MKRITRSILLLIAATLTVTAFAQNDSRPLALQAGTGHLVNGTCTIKLNELRTANEYFVSVTPAGLTHGLYVTKSDGVFTVNGKQTEKVDFDYVIFVNVPVAPAAGKPVQKRVSSSK